MWISRMKSTLFWLFLLCSLVCLLQHDVCATCHSACVQSQPQRRPVVIRQSTIMNRIVDEKRQRTYSIDDTTITEDNKVIRSTDVSEGKGQGQLVIVTSGQSRVRTDSHNSTASLSSQKRAQFLDVERIAVPRSRHGSVSVSITASQRSLNQMKKAIASPFARQVWYAVCLYYSVYLYANDWELRVHIK